MNSQAARDLTPLVWMYRAIVARYTTAAAVLLMLPCAIFMLAVACGCRIKCCCDRGGPPTRRRASSW